MEDGGLDEGEDEEMKRFKENDWRNRERMIQVLFIFFL